MLRMTSPSASARAGRTGSVHRHPRRPSPGQHGRHVGMPSTARSASPMTSAMRSVDEVDRGVPVAQRRRRRLDRPHSRPAGSIENRRSSVHHEHDSKSPRVHQLPPVDLPARGQSGDSTGARQVDVKPHSDLDLVKIARRRSTHSSRLDHCAHDQLRISLTGWWWPIGQPTIPPGNRAVIRYVEQCRWLATWTDIVEAAAQFHRGGVAGVDSPDRRMSPPLRRGSPAVLSVRPSRTTASTPDGRASWGRFAAHALA